MIPDVVTINLPTRRNNVVPRKKQDRENNIYMSSMRMSQQIGNMKWHSSQEEINKSWMIKSNDFNNW